MALSIGISPQSEGSFRIRNQALVNDMSVGVGSGAVAGGLWGLTCGPLAVLCVPLAAATGMVTGAAAGAAVGVTGALSDEKAGQVRDRLRHLQQEHPLLTDLKREINDRARRYWALDAEPATSVVTVELQDLQLISTRDERIRCVVRVLVAVTSGTAPHQARPRQKPYEYVGPPPGSLAAWLDEGNDFLSTSLDSASRQIAAQIVSDLAVTKPE